MQHKEWPTSSIPVFLVFLALLGPSSSLPPIAYNSLNDEKALNERAHFLNCGIQTNKTTA